MGLEPTSAYAQLYSKQSYCLSSISPAPRALRIETQRGYEAGRRRSARGPTPAGRRGPQPRSAPAARRREAAERPPYGRACAGTRTQNHPFTRRVHRQLCYTGSSAGAPLRCASPAAGAARRCGNRRAAPGRARYAARAFNFLAVLALLLVLCPLTGYATRPPAMSVAAPCPCRPLRRVPRRQPILINLKIFSLTCASKFMSIKKRCRRSCELLAARARAKRLPVSAHSASASRLRAGRVSAAGAASRSATDAREAS